MITYAHKNFKDPTMTMKTSLNDKNMKIYLNKKNVQLNKNFYLLYSFLYN